jgi:hypothetical protein
MASWASAKAGFDGSGPPGPIGPPGPGRPGGGRAAGPGRDLLGRRHDLADPLLDLGLGQGAEEAVHELAADHRDDHGNALDLEGLGQARVGVHVDLGQDPLTVGLAGQLLQHWAELLARTTPLGPQVDDDGGRP